MRKVWIVVANGTQAHIYNAENVNTLVSLKTFSHNEGHMNKKDLNADRNGRTTQSTNFGTDTMEEKTPVKTKEAISFAAEIASFLEAGLKDKECERLYLIAKSPFLGHIRSALSPNVTKLIEKEVQKDLTSAKPKEIREYLPPVL